VQEKYQEMAGKQVFFLYPHSVIEQEITSAMIMNQYEVYFLKDHNKALRVINQFYRSLLFINIDERLKEEEWEEYIKKIKANEKNQNVRIGILTYNEDPQLTQKYLMDVGVECGFIQLKLGMEQSKKILLKTLEANEAKGRRKYIRANCASSDRVTFSADIMTNVHKGKVLDISIVGAAIQFKEGVSLKQGTLISGVSFNLRGVFCKIDVVIYASREDQSGIYVVLFKGIKNEATLDKLHTFIHKWMQEEMDSLVKRL